MARTKKKTSRRAPAPRVVPVRVVTPWERNPAVVRLTRSIRSLERKTARAMVDAVMRLGEMLTKVNEELPHGEWRRWLDQAVRIKPSTAQRYMAVYAWARTKPREWRNVADLSITKIYRLLPLEPEQRRRLYRRPVPIPGTVRRLPLGEMTVAELDRVIRDLTAPSPTGDPVPRLLKGAHHRLAGLRAHADELIEHRTDVDPEAIAALHEDLLELTQRLEAAFEL